MLNIYVNVNMTRIKKKKKHNRGGNMIQGP